MRVIICSTIREFALHYADAAFAAGMDAVEEANPQEFGSQLFRDPEAIGVLWTAGFASAVMTVRKMRDAEIFSRLIVLTEHEGPEVEFRVGVAKVLEAGADDVQHAGIDQRELAARLRALSQRGTYFEHKRFKIAGGEFVSDKGVFYGPKETVHLTVCESRLLIELARNQDRALSKEELITRIYGYDDDSPEGKIIDVYVCKVRKKIVTATGGVDVIRTVWGRGYTLVAEGFQSEHRFAGKTA